ncbi:MAG: hypothetical protein M1832_002968 [Thelocarpon impressellum]|nr:MAG: hypothetical protein M1832_002968 [Thelocarpon impressellum]
MSTPAAYRPLEGKLAVVTGSSRGIGAAIARNLASKGCSLLLNYTSESSASRTTALSTELSTAHKITVHVVQADMGTPEGPAQVIAGAKKHFSHPDTGVFRIDIIINNAGVAGDAPLAEVRAEVFHRQYAVNVLGPLLLVQAALPHLPHDRSGRIVNLSSVSSSLGLAGQTVYGGTKAALDSMTRVWARELAERATVNAVNPGPVATDMYSAVPEGFESHIRPWMQITPLAPPRADLDGEDAVERNRATGGRPAYDHEIAGVVGMLCSAESGWCTGSVVCANGGMAFGR